MNTGKRHLTGMNSSIFYYNKLLLARLRPDIREQFVEDEINDNTVVHILRMRIKSMSATSGPPIGPVLGQYAIPISKFCTEFNDRSSIYNEGVDVFVTLYHYYDGTYSFDLYAPVSATCFKRAAGIHRSFGDKQTLWNGILTPYMFLEAVMYKCLHDGGLGERSMHSVLSQNLGTLRSIGMTIIDIRKYI